MLSLYCFVIFLTDEEDEDSEEGGGDMEISDGIAPNPKRRKLCREDGLCKSLKSGLYPQFLGIAGPVVNTDPLTTSCLEFVKLLWPDCLCDHIASETNAYARQSGAKDWVDTDSEEVWVFLGIVIMMGIHRLPTIGDYWSRNPFLGVIPVKQAMSLNRFRALWRYLHCDDNRTLTNPSDIKSKIRKRFKL